MREELPMRCCNDSPHWGGCNGKTVNHENAKGRKRENEERINRIVDPSDAAFSDLLGPFVFS